MMLVPDKWLYDFFAEMFHMKFQVEEFLLVVQV